MADDTANIFFTTRRLQAERYIGLVHELTVLLNAKHTLQSKEPERHEALLGGKEQHKRHAQLAEEQDSKFEAITQEKHKEMRNMVRSERKPTVVTNRGTRSN